ncbi:MAG: alkaline phosphatase family protein [Bacillota bacterium]|nr:alkaline phosphatase family protein [Bacillota bacterium]
MSSIIQPDYDHCIVNTVASILKYYKASTDYSTINILDKALLKSYKNVVLMVFDGMGTDMLRKNLPEDSFLRRHMAEEIKSVYPCTTTAAMTSYYTGLSPKEHGWLGWSLYFKEYGRIIDTFLNTDSFTKESIGRKSAAEVLMPYERIYEKIYRATDGEVDIYTINPSGIRFLEDVNTNIRVESVGEICEEIKALCSNSNEKFIMSYWPEPDSTMHEYGTCTPETTRAIETINQLVEAMCEELKNTLVIISADHGQVDIHEEVYLNDIPEIEECLVMPSSVEPRAVSFFVKYEMRDVFESRFQERFGEDFILYKKEEVIEKGLFGYGKMHKKVSDFLGDYLACAVGQRILRYRTINSTDKFLFKGHHAGLRPEEMLVPLIIKMCE